MSHWLDISQLSWQTALVLRVLVGFGLAQILIKHVANQGRRTERFLWQFSITFGIAAVFALSEGTKITNGPLFMIVVAISIVSTFGTFYSWKAIAISQSRNALFTFWDDIIAMGLSYVILKEGQFVTPATALGIGLSFISLFLFIHHQRTKAGDAHSIPKKFYLYVGIYSIAWGFGYFGQRLWAYNDLPIAEFLLAWYAGAFVTALLIYLLYRERQDEVSASPVTVWGVVTIAALSVTIFTSMALTIVTYRAPQVVIQPVFFVSEMILSALIGLFVFGERKQFFDSQNRLDRRKTAYFCLGALGALTVGLSFRG